MKSLFRLLVVFLLTTQLSFAQKTVTGVVSDPDGLPLPGATVLVQNTTTGVTTDFDGNFSINVSEGQSLEFSFVGYETSAIVVGSGNVINVSLSLGNQLDEVIVTSLGITREKRALGYAVSEVDNSQIESRASGDVARVLSGKASGVQVTNQGGISGSGTSVVIRGLSTFSSSNQPLFVVDGVPFQSDTNAQGGFTSGNNGSSRFLDLDPNNIESVNVLKGLAAATLYGSQGRNGVVLITTKSGTTASGMNAQKNEVTVNTSYFSNELAMKPDYQMEYGNGFNQNFGWFFSNWGPSFREGGPAGWGKQSQINGEVSGQPGFLKHPYNSNLNARFLARDLLPLIGLSEDSLWEWKPYDSTGDLFQPGRIVNTNINFRGQSDDGKVSYNVNYGNLDDQGFTPGNTLRRNNISFGGRAVLSNKITVNGTLNYSFTDFKSPPIAAAYSSGSSDSSLYGNVFYTPRSVSIADLPYAHPITGASIYYRSSNGIQHPLWTVNNTQDAQATHRLYGGTSVQYDISDNLNVQYRYGYDVYSEDNTSYQNKGGVDGSVESQSGFYEKWNNTSTIFNHQITINGDYELDSDWSMTFNAGATSNAREYDRNGVRSTGQNVFNVLRHYNFNNQEEIEFYSRRNVLGVFGQASLDYQNYLYITLASRTDWVSNLSEENRSITYPSASISFVPSSVLDFGNLPIDFLKVRASYGTSATYPTGYPIASTLSLDTKSFQVAGTDVISNTTGSQLGNTALKPELLAELEFGLEANILDNRLSAEVSYFQRNTTDLIISQPLDPSTGYTSTSTNIGKIEATGWEVDLNADWIRGDKFNWSTSLNYTTNQAIVVDLGQDTDQIVYSGFSTRGNAAITGLPLTSMIGTSVGRDASGAPIIDASGSYTSNNDTNYKTNKYALIGDANPDFIANIANTITYGDFSFNFLFNATIGGDMYSSYMMTLLGRGITTDTVDRELPYILPGVLSDGSPNNKQIDNATTYFGNLILGADELRTWDASVLRLSEVSLTYDVPSKWLDKTPFGAASVSAQGFNLWYDAYNTPEGTNYDPNIAGLGVGNGSGFEYFNGVSAKRYGVSLKLTF
ncbi:MAG: SusC/RagA family TonB-linked outer membrane protein [Flavobacteriaceae bacterium]|nr:SusC/RagA family TonB-linked outer membrane protein [Flavobacteriaceae bacterium]